jgi:hypothetical protein
MRAACVPASELPRSPARIFPTAPAPYTVMSNAQPQSGPRDVGASGGLAHEEEPLMSITHRTARRPVASSVEASQQATRHRTCAVAAVLAAVLLVRERRTGQKIIPLASLVASEHYLLRGDE